MTIETESSGQTAGNQVSGPSRRPSGTSLNWCHKPKQMSFLKAKANRFGQASCSVQGLGARVHRGLGPGPQRLGARAPRLLGLGAGPRAPVILKSVLVGSQLKRLPQMWGPGGKRARYPPYPPYPPPPTHAAGCKGERKRVFTLS